MPAGSSDRPRSTRARRAPSSTTIVPDMARAKAIHSLRAGSRRSRGRTTVPMPGRPSTAPVSTPGRLAAAITARTPDHDAILAAASFDAIPPLPRTVPRPPAMRSISWSTSTISSMSEPPSTSRGSALSSPGASVSRTRRSAADQVGEEGGQEVVVAEADLVVGDGVVLVHHRHHAQLEQAVEGLAGVEVLGAVGEVEGGQQHLAHHQPVRAEGGVVDAHQPALADGGDGLEGGDVVRSAAGQAQGGQAGGDRPRRHHHHPVALAAQVGHLGAQLLDGGHLRSRRGRR